MTIQEILQDELARAYLEQRHPILRDRLGEMSAWSRPGIGLTQEYLINLISVTFGLSDHKWVTDRSREVKYAIPRQVLMTCLIKYMGYTLASAGAVCGRDHATALYSHKVTIQTLQYDHVYRERVNRVLGECSKIYHAQKSK